MIKVGGASEIEVKERKDRVDDALHATRAAVEEGIVPGGGTALLYATKALEGLKGENDDQTRGIDIIRKALQAPVRQIAENAGYDGAVVAGKLIDGKDPTLGFNAQTEVYENLVKAGVIDPTKVVRAALQDAASVAGLLITTEATIAEAAGRQAGSGDGRRRHGRNGRNGLLSPPVQSEELEGPVERSAGPSSLAARLLSMASASLSWLACSALGAGGRWSRHGGRAAAAPVAFERAKQSHSRRVGLHFCADAQKKGRPVGRPFELLV